MCVRRGQVEEAENPGDITAEDLEHDGAEEDRGAPNVSFAAFWRWQAVNANIEAERQGERHGIRSQVARQPDAHVRGRLTMIEEVLVLVARYTAT
jgi:hypothetical protein